MLPTHSHLLFLCSSSSSAPPDLIDSFLKSVDISSSPSDTPFRHDRHLNLISALSQSSSPLVTKLSEPLLDPTFPLRSLLSPRSFTDPASSFLRLANTNPEFFRRIIENNTGHILDIAISTAVNSIRVVPEVLSEPRCLDFGRATPNWVVLLNAIADVKMDLTQNSDEFNSIRASHLTFLILSTASTNNELSTAAVQLSRIITLARFSRIITLARISRIITLARFSRIITLARFSPIVTLARFSPIVTLARFSPIVTLARFSRIITLARISRIITLARISRIVTLARIST
ncbi:hypothetical protein BLNAU_7134 [Blattamonas nauphoetae]|uniref:Uncharacterized protein n=1 Tax=Blattamonas nauphoetae TaxID=2049346 RepID=A0ABQ9Y2J8_9EUKA|nr:hypothetical protein BLNAU_7134 [Blattamonas nauphoetae]